MTRALQALAALLVLAPAALAQDVITLYATQIENQTPWENEAQATGMPGNDICTDSVSTYARNPVSTDTHYLRGVAFDGFTLPYGKVIVSVGVDVLCRYDNNGHSGAIDVRVDLNGSQLTLLTASFFNNSNVTDCRWMAGAVGDISSYADWIHNPSWINQIDVKVRRSTTTPQNQTTLRVKALRITVVMADDSDGDFIPNSVDNCDYAINPQQQNADGDSYGDACDPCTDTDGDYWGNPGFSNSSCPTDNCPDIPNNTQSDVDGDHVGDVCDSCTDTDRDGFRDPGVTGQSCPPDNCPWASNPLQSDQDGDGLGDACDPCPASVACDCNGNGIADATDRVQHPDWDRNQDGALDQCLRPVAFPDTMQTEYPFTAYRILESNDLAANSPVRPNGVVYVTEPVAYPAQPRRIIIVGGPQHGSLAEEIVHEDAPLSWVRMEFHPSPGYACGPDAFYYQVVDDLGVPSLPALVSIAVEPGNGYDCNANQNFDQDDCLQGTSRDCNNDLIPDECQCAFDQDHDGFLDVCDSCPNDYLKSAPGVCGCGIPDTDTDNDGAPDCIDGCPADPAKVQPGACGCGSADTDSDGDSVADCLDGCPGDPAKTLPGLCGCGVADTDADGDGTPNCTDGCPDDPQKTAPGACGCGHADVDTDGDGLLDCLDNCPDDANPDQVDCDLDGRGDLCDPPLTGEDCNLNGVPDACDIAAGTSLDADADGVPDECLTTALGYCFGHAGNAPCPCQNFSPPSLPEGCLSSLGVGGRLAAAGAASLSGDSLSLSGAGMPNSSALYFQGTSALAGGAGVAVGDGLRCVGGAIVRIGTRNNAGGGSQIPVAGEAPISQMGSVASPGERFYQVWYRNSASFCTPSAFNLTSAVRVVWTL